MNKDLIQYDEPMRSAMEQAGNPASGLTLREVALAMDARNQTVRKQVVRNVVRKGVRK